jgi:nucleoside 2-deoxyribosyltransferase
MYKADVYNVFIASPSDVVIERDHVEIILHEWNTLNSQKRKIILQPVRWEKNVYSEFSGTPQEIINKQILESTDILVAIFHSKIGSPTKNYDSGTVEELKTHIATGKPAMVFFSKEPIDQDCINYEQLGMLDSFKEWCKNYSVYFEYNSKEEFKDLFRNQITLKVNSIPGNDTSQNQTSKKTSRSKEDAVDFISRIPLFQENIDLLDKYFCDIGTYRSWQLNPFLERIKILKLLENSNGTFRIQMKPRMDGLKQSDIDSILKDINDGKFDRIFEE